MSLMRAQTFAAGFLAVMGATHVENARAVLNQPIWYCVTSTSYYSDGTKSVPTRECEYMGEWSNSGDHAVGGSTRGTDWDAGGRVLTDLGLSRVVAQVGTEATTCDATAHPVQIASGNKVFHELDIAASPLPSGASLNVARHYDKSLNRVGIFGQRWASNIEKSLTFDYSGTQCSARLDTLASCAASAQPLTKIYATGSNGFSSLFTKDGDGIWRNSGGSLITSISGGWKRTTASGETEVYDSFGRPMQILDERGIGLTYEYNSSNQLATVTHTSGRSIQFTWSGSKVVAIVAPNGKAYGYGYNSSGYLASVVYPDNLGTRTYHYENINQPGGLTGISINGMRYSRYAYQTDGRAAWSGLEGAVERSTFTYGADANGKEYTDVQNALGQTTRYQIADVNGGKRVIGVERPASAACAAGARYTAYDANGSGDFELDAYDVKTDYTYDANGQITQKVIGIGKLGETDQQQITQYVWDTNRKGRLLQVKTFGTSLSAPISETTYSYYPDGDAKARLLMSVAIRNLSAVGISGNTLTTTYAYTLHPSGMVATVTVDGPLAGTGDAVVKVYDAAGNLTAVQNSLGHTVAYSNYNALGQPGRIVGVNGAITDYTYNARGNVLTVKNWIGSTAHTTTNVYDTRGRLSSVTTPDGETISYDYDATDRVTSISKVYPTVDEDGDPETYEESVTEAQAITYNLNSDPLSTTTSYKFAAKQWVEELGKAINVGYTTTQHQAYIDYDAGGFVSARRGNNGQNVRYTYNANGDLATTTDSLNRTTSYAYDRHRRVNHVTDAKSGHTYMTYDPVGRLIQAKDPRNLITSYVYDGFGQLWSQTSPDSGTTTFQYNATGQRTLMTRNDGSWLDYIYDGLGRLTSTGTTGNRRGYTYDSCSNGKGHLCGLSRAPAAEWTQFAYTPQGRVSIRRDSTYGSDDWTGYAYDGRGRLTGMSYPSGVSVGYGYSNGQVGSVTTTFNGATQTVALPNGYQAFGPPAEISYGNGLWRQNNYDLDRRRTGISTNAPGGPVQSLTYAFNANNEITKITNAVDAGLTQTYDYDELSRLISVVATSANVTMDYDANSNRTLFNWASATQIAVETTSNRATQHYNTAIPTGGVFYTHDGRGNRQTQSWGGSTATYAYDDFNRLKSVSRNAAQGYTNTAYGTGTYPAGATSYVVNAMDQRVGKSGPAGTSRYIYAGQNQMLAEHTNGVWSSYLWLGGELVGLVRNNQLYYVHGDHLGRPEIVTNSAKAVVWRAKNYHSERAVTLDSIGGLNLGFPGQYFDAESALWNNGFRDYDSVLGRYIQSDPIGLAGGLNTYAYVGGNPVSRIDPLGLECNGQGCWNTPTELAYANSGNYSLYYQAACSGGDSYACAARMVATGQGMTGVIDTAGVRFTNNNLLHALKKAGSDCPEQEMEAIRKELMNARVALLAGASSSNPRVMTGAQASQFHNNIFSSYGATNGLWGGPVFGGDLPGGNASPWQWCSAPACQP